MKSEVFSKITSSKQIYRSRHVDDRYPGRVAALSNAIVVPHFGHEKLVQMGVITTEGEPVAEAEVLFSPKQVNLCPKRPTASETEWLEGTHLYGGCLRYHFGHFLCESFTRLWAVDVIKEKVDSIVYMPFGRLEAAQVAVERLKFFLSHFGLEIPIILLERPTQVENLIVPTSGFGWSERFDGSMEFRALLNKVTDRLKLSQATRDIYISRTGMNSHRLGGVFFEDRLEAIMAENGYEIFHPQKHPLEVQMSTYREAKRIVAVDGSALHLPPFAAPYGVNVAVISRGAYGVQKTFKLQIEGLLRRPADCINHTNSFWKKVGRRPTYDVFVEMDFPKVLTDLKSLGYINHIPEFSVPTDDEILQEAVRLEREKWTPKV